MTITGQNAEIYQGDFRILDIVVDDLTTLSGVQLEYLVYKPTTKETVIQKSLADGITVTSDTTFNITLNPEDTTNLLGKYNHQCRLIDSENKPYTLFVGYFSVVYTQDVV